jgi:hypothetical protein
MSDWPQGEQPRMSNRSACETVDPLATFWRLAADAGANSSNPLRSYERLKAQFVSTQPNASPAEYEAAMKRLARLCRV